MFGEIKRHRSATGADLAYRHVEAKGTPRAILLVCHGLAEHAGRYHRFAEAMAGRGYHVYAHDHRGHGETRAADAPFGQFARRNGVIAVIEDVQAMREAAVAAHPGLPVILFGHSMGGLISLNTAVTHPGSFDAVAVWNANFHPGIAGRLAQCILKAERMLKGSDVPSALLPRLTFGAWGNAISGRRTPFDWLSRDATEVDKYIADPLCGFDASVSLWLDVFALSYRAPQTSHLNRLPRSMPIYLVGGGKDPATENARAVEWLARRLKQQGFSNTTTQIYQDFRHESLNEVGAEIAVADFAAWCDRITSEA